ncbi:MAG: hypothetical protein HQL56_05100 [Magnetococcales bacterium]|nr:hypothetical protein [Magnetococcales bacterium]
MRSVPLLLAALCLLWPLTRAGAGGFPASPECNWFGASIGAPPEQWPDLSGNLPEVEKRLLAHCNHRYCGQEPRRHFSMAYEVMPCSRECLQDKRKQYRAACTTQ